MIRKAKSEDFGVMQGYIDNAVKAGWEVVNYTISGTITTLREAVLIKREETPRMTKVMRVAQRYYPETDSFDAIQSETYQAWEILFLAACLEKAGIK